MAHRILAAFAIAILALATSVAVAQPYLENAPLLNRVVFANMSAASGLTNQLPVVIAGGFAFTTAYNYTNQTISVIATSLNASATTSLGSPTFYFTLPHNPSSIFSPSYDRVGVVCNDSVVFFGASATSVWYVGTVSNANFIFDFAFIHADVPSFDVPAIGANGNVYIGTANRQPSGTTSLIYRIDPATAVVLGTATVRFRATNYPLQFDQTNLAVVYALAFDNFGVSSVIAINIASMTMVGNAMNTNDGTITVRFGVFNGVAAVVSYSNNWWFFNVRNGLLIKNGITTCLGGIQFAPIALGTRWYLSCNNYLNVFDIATLTLLTPVPLSPSGNNYFTAAAVSDTGIVVACAASMIYVVNGSAPTLVPVANISSIGYIIEPATGASFVPNTTIVLVSYRTYEQSGAVLAVDVVSGAQAGQITNVNPVGAAVWDSDVGLVAVAQSRGHLISAFNTFFDAVATNFITQLSDSGYGSQVAFVANGTIGYYLSFGSMYTVNLTTGDVIAKASNIIQGSWNLSPVVVDKYVCFNDYEQTYCYNTITSVLLPVQPTCEIYARNPFVVGPGPALYIICGEGDMFSWILGTGTALMLPSYSYPPIVSASGDLTFAYTSGHIVGYTLPLTSDNQAPVVNFSSHIYALSAPTFVGNNVAFLGYEVPEGTADPAAVSDGTIFQLFVFTSGGTAVGSVTMPAGVTYAYFVASQTSGVWGANGWVYLFNSTAVTAVNLNTMKVAFAVDAVVGGGTLGTPFFTASGGMCFYFAVSGFTCVNALTGQTLWTAESSSTATLPRPIEWNGILFWSDGTSVLGFDSQTGRPRTAVGFGAQSINGLALSTVSERAVTIYVTTSSCNVVATTAVFI